MKVNRSQWVIITRRDCRQDLPDQEDVVSTPRNDGSHLRNND